MGISQLNGGNKLKRQGYIITLCPKCRADFDNAGVYIRRADPEQEHKEKCTYCSVRDGYDYEIIPKGRRENRQ
jgi:hypothetical protein